MSMSTTININRSFVKRSCDSLAWPVTRTVSEAQEEHSDSAVSELDCTADTVRHRVSHLRDQAATLRLTRTRSSCYAITMMTSSLRASSCEQPMWPLVASGVCAAGALISLSPLLSSHAECQAAPLMRLLHSFDSVGRVSAPAAFSAADLE